MNDDDCFDRVHLHDGNGELILTRNLIPPFDQPPGIVICDERYFVLFDDGIHHEVSSVHWLKGKLNVEA